MKHKKPIAKIILSVIVLGLFSWFIASNWEDISSLSIPKPSLIGASAVFILISLYAAGMVNELTMEPHGVKPSRREVYALAAINRFLNQISTNYVGATVRAVYFKKQYGVSYTKFSSSFAVANILQILISLILSASLFLVIGGDGMDMSSAVIIAIIGGALAMVLFLPIQFLQRTILVIQRHFSAKSLRHAYNLTTEYGRVRSYPDLFPKMAFWMASLTAISGYVIYLLYASMGAEVGMLEAVFIAGIANLSIVLSVTPAGLGIREGMIVFGSSLVGVPVALSLAVSILLRIVVTLTTGLLSLLFLKTFTNSRE